MAINYEWDMLIMAENLEDIEDHDFHDRLDQYFYYTLEQIRSERYQLVLNRTKYTEEDGVIEQTYAYVETDEDGRLTLPESFVEYPGGPSWYKVPKKYQSEFAKWIANREEK